ncbi:hypothetical protein [uncultured Shewanella sp.]|uniref:hypothetical protein n=1 Tax=uncultured Shewanella sp. TaxID=173975 RepID=UPI00260EDCDD|nr:hypothetical protein [uncultured Shewanella sp.]
MKKKYMLLLASMLSLSSHASTNYTLEQTGNYTSGFVNNYDNSANFICPSNMFLTGIYSIHNGHYEDRIFKFTCHSFKTQSLGSSTSKIIERSRNLDHSSGYQNEFDQPLSYTCPAGEYIVGVSSYHDGHYEDRRFSFTCSPMLIDGNRTAAKDCNSTPTSTYDTINNLVARFGAFTSIYSVHSNQAEDRQTSLQYCGDVIQY